MYQGKENFHFSWPLMKAVLHGHSILDVPRLEIHSMEEATHFILAYGFDPNNLDDLELIWSFFDEAIQFIEKSLLDPHFSRVPEHLRSRNAVKDIRRMLILASEPSATPDQTWSCALLRVMHVLIHLAHDPRLKYFDEAQNQVLSRLDNYIFSEDDGTTYLGKKGQAEVIKLLVFKKKDRKDREREIIKLLHKSENSVEEIYDRIGFRMVTQTKFDASRALRLLIKENIISIPNIRPNRSKNTLIDIDRLESEISRIIDLEKKARRIPEAKWFRRIERRIGYRRKGLNILNPHSSEHYRSIQFTCRELVKIRNPQYHFYGQIKSKIENLSQGKNILDQIFSTPLNPFQYVFYPYEIQIMDVKAYADSVFGKSNHEEYRKKQLETARTRVFGTMH